MKSNKLYCPEAPIKLIGLDLDGTVFDNRKKISERNKEAIAKAIRQGVVVIPATGRPLAGVPREFAAIEGVKYALTANGAAIYNLETGECIYRDALSTGLACEVISRLKKHDVMVDAFIGGMGYVEQSKLAEQREYAMSEVIRQYIMNTRKTVSDLPEHIRNGNCLVEKITINFKPAPEDKDWETEDKIPELLWKKEILEILAEYPQLVSVSGVPTNLEITMATAHKGNGMLKLGEYLGIRREEIMVCGDSENDMEMILAAGFGVAMANGTEKVKEAADYITDSNEEDGVAKVIEKFVLKK